MQPLALSPRDLIAVRDVASPTATVALRVDDDGIQVVSEERRRPSVVVTGEARPARRIADALARSLGARVSYVDEATACAAALDEPGALLLHWSSRVTLSLAGAAAASFGHLGVDPLGPPCACGGRGCLEDQVSAPALVARFAQTTGRTVTVGELTALARRGDVVAGRLVGTAAALLARQLAPVCASASVTRVALAGALAAAGPALCARLEDELRLIWPTPVAVIAFDPLAALRGALRIARRGPL